MYSKPFVSVISASLSLNLDFLLSATSLKMTFLIFTISLRCSILSSWPVSKFHISLNCDCKCLQMELLWSSLYCSLGFVFGFFHFFFVVAVCFFVFTFTLPMTRRWAFPELVIIWNDIIAFLCRLFIGQVVSLIFHSSCQAFQNSREPWVFFNPNIGY